MATEVWSEVSLPVDDKSPKKPTRSDRTGAVSIHSISCIKEGFRFGDRDVQGDPRVSTRETQAVGLEAGVLEPRLNRADGRRRGLKELGDLFGSPVLAVGRGSGITDRTELLCKKR